MNAADTSSTPRTAPPALWCVARAFLLTLHALFGAPEDIAFQHTLTAKAHKLMANWLRVAEALLRRLICIEAAAYAKSKARPMRRRTPRARAPRVIVHEPAQPEQWRVSFRCFKSPRPSSPACEGRGRDAVDGGASGQSFDAMKRHRAGAKRFRSAWPLAERYEVLIRAYNDPAPYARRAAHRLHADPARLAGALRAPPEAEPRVERFAEIGQALAAAWAPHFSSA